MGGCGDGDGGWEKARKIKGMMVLGREDGLLRIDEEGKNANEKRQRSTRCLQK
jgi:hypothetical protein